MLRAFVIATWFAVLGFLVALFVRIAVELEVREVMNGQVDHWRWIHSPWFSWAYHVPVTLALTQHTVRLSVIVPLELLENTSWYAVFGLIVALIAQRLRPATR